MLLFLPEILINCLILFLLVMLCVKPHDLCKKIICGMAYGLIISGAYFILLANCSSACITSHVFQNNYIIDSTTFTLKGFIILASGIIIIYIKNYLITHNIFKAEFFALFLFSILGQLICISSVHMLITYLGIELMALAIYGLVAFNYHRQNAIEAAIKYMVLGAIASALLLYGISMVYGATGSLIYSEILQAIKGSSATYNNILMLLGVFFIIAALSFKLSLVPFHMWAPDVYEGSNTASTLILSTIPKLAIVTLFYRLFNNVFIGLSGNYIIVLEVIAIASLFVANLTAIMQTNIKRILAYSTISHIAFILLAIIASHSELSINKEFSSTSVLFYAITYVFSAMAIFAILLGLSSQKDDVSLYDLKGFAKTNPFIGFCLLICMFSLAGIPPAIGFYAKLLVIQGLVQTQHYYIAIFAVLSSVIAAFYYLRIVKVMYFDTKNADEHTHALEFIQTKSAKLFIGLNSILLLVLGMFPKMLLSLLKNLI